MSPEKENEDFISLRTLTEVALPRRTEKREHGTVPVASCVAIGTLARPAEQRTAPAEHARVLAYLIACRAAACKPLSAEKAKASARFPQTRESLR